MTLPGEIGAMASDEYPYLTQLSVPDRLRIAAYEARDHGVSAIHLRAILDAADALERLIDWEGQNRSSRKPITNSHQIGARCVQPSQLPDVWSFLAHGHPPRVV